MEHSRFAAWRFQTERIRQGDSALYRKIVIERPLLDEDGTPVIDRKGNRKADASLRDYEMVPLKEDIHEYFRREVLPFVPDAWIDKSKTKIGYEIPFTRYFYKFTPLRDSSVIMEDITLPCSGIRFES